MKTQFLRIVFLLTAFVGTISVANAQCVTDNSISASGLYQNNQYCFAKGVYTELTWQFKNYDSVAVIVGGTVIHASVDSVRIDSIINLPCGITFTTSKRTFAKLENGCIALAGTTNDSVGSYQIVLGVTAFVHGINDSHTGDPLPLAHRSSDLGTNGTWYVRVLNSGTACSAPDTTSAGLLSRSCGNVGVAYTQWNAINDQPAFATNFTNNPNPFSTTTQIAFTAEQSKKVTFKVFDLVGKTLHEETLQTTEGRNIINFNRKGLTNGIYFYSITDGNQNFTNKMVITD